MSDTNPARLGELRRVTNKNVREHFESKEYVVGWVMLDGAVMSVAFTTSELERPTARAQRNKEDLEVLAGRPPSWDDVQELKEEIAILEAQKQSLIERGLLARILNTH